MVSREEIAEETPTVNFQKAFKYQLKGFFIVHNKKIN